MTLVDRDPGDEQLDLAADDPEAWDGLTFGEWMETLAVTVPEADASEGCRYGLSRRLGSDG